MSRLCARCHQSPRCDDSLSTQDFEHGSAQVCRACVAELTGQEEEVRTYPPGQRRNFPVCGLCRMASREDDRLTLLRLFPEDVFEGEPEPGLYLACRDCLHGWREAIHPRLVRQGLAPEGGDPQAVRGNALM